MREIKFRGQRTDTKEWVYGCLTQNAFGAFIQCEYVADSETGQEPAICDHKVIPESVGEFTGLKDKNGIEVYEGDIVEDEEKKGEKRIGVVEYCDKYPEFKIELKVIGNKFQNPELLKV